MSDRIGVKNYKIRKIEYSEYYMLEDFLYEAIFIPEGAAKPPRDIIDRPELQVYLTDFGKKKGDIGFVAEVDNRAAGAVWVRIMNDYGHIDDETPSFAISLYENYRNHGIGTALMRKMLNEMNYPAASCGVSKVATSTYNPICYTALFPLRFYRLFCNLSLAPALSHTCL